MDGYPPPATYRWEEGVAVWSDPAAGGEPDSAFEWGFSLDVADPA